MFNLCEFGEICIKSIDGLSYNCVKEDMFSNSPSSVNIPLNHFVKFFEPNPCLSSPCREKEICRVVKRDQYVCVRELEFPADIGNHLPSKT